jgi:hypothetical protein
MAVALKVKLFKYPHDLTAFCALAGNNVTTIVAILFDATSNMHVLYYKET